MSWKIEYSKRAKNFIEQQDIREEVRELIKKF